MIKPTVGRIVWYYGPNCVGQQPQAAIVVYVHSDTCVNLTTFDHNGNVVVNPPRSVLLVQEGTERPAGGNFCEWMPYQVGKAKEDAAKAAEVPSARVPPELLEKPFVKMDPLPELKPLSYLPPGHPGKPAPDAASSAASAGATQPAGNYQKNPE